MMAQLFMISFKVSTSERTDHKNIEGKHNSVVFPVNLEI